MLDVALGDIRVLNIGTVEAVTRHSRRLDNGGGLSLGRQTSRTSSSPPVAVVARDCPASRRLRELPPLRRPRGRPAVPNSMKPTKGRGWARRLREPQVLPSSDLSGRPSTPSRCHPSSQFSSQLPPFSPVRPGCVAAVWRSCERGGPRRTVGKATWKAGWVQALAGSNPASSAARLGRSPTVMGTPGPKIAERSQFWSQLSPLPRFVGGSGPDEPVNTGGDFMPDRVGDVLVAGSHRGAGPAHDPHQRPPGTPRISSTVAAVWRAS